MRWRRSSSRSEGMTSYERMLHDDYRARFGRAFDAV